MLLDCSEQREKRYFMGYPREVVAEFVRSKKRIAEIENYEKHYKNFDSAYIELRRYAKQYGVRCVKKKGRLFLVVEDLYQRGKGK